MSELRTNRIFPRDGLPAGAAGGGIIQVVRAQNTTANQIPSSTSTGAFDASGNSITLVQSDIDAARVTLNNEDAAVKYKTDRANAYPSIGDQLDMQYKVKTDSPKP